MRAANEGGMRRLSFFILLGPFLSWFIFIAMLLPKLLTGPTFDGAFEFFLIALLVCYVPGVLPLLVIAGIDYLLSRYHWAIGVLVCAVVGFGAAYALFYFGAQAAGAQKDFQEYGFFLGLMGGIPAAVCSWLSSEKAA
jgi:hypothetical protein